MHPTNLGSSTRYILLILLLTSAASHAAEAERATKYSAWQYDSANGRYRCTYSYTNSARRPGQQLVFYYPDESRRGVYYFADRGGRIWACCVRPGTPDYTRHAMKWYRFDKTGKWARRTDGECPQPPDGGQPIASAEDGPLPVPPAPREFESLAEAERKLAQRFHEALAEVEIGNGQIVAVDFAANEVDVKVLAELAKASALRRLYLDTTNADDNGLKHLSAARGLAHLDLSQTSVSDAGLKHLSGMTSLRTLVLRGCQGVSAKGVKELKKSLPKLLVTGPGEGREVDGPAP